MRYNSLLLYIVYISLSSDPAFEVTTKLVKGHSAAATTAAFEGTGTPKISIAAYDSAALVLLTVATLASSTEHAQCCDSPGCECSDIGTFELNAI